ncbi:hypothetical protein HOLleu_32085 [Holothuria leucospilota]|uniref:Uncharacterized protein n=1 Tax=Holothuria leucospilota TaxID=206669 RepID=A0A9Q0YQY4_HOLLE|nr:hypothetical protein HOLleu_32085 [Holothuria leucospilota]
MQLTSLVTTQPKRTSASPATSSRPALITTRNRLAIRITKENQNCLDMYGRSNGITPILTSNGE